MTDLQPKYKDLPLTPMSCLYSYVAVFRNYLAEMKSQLELFAKSNPNLVIKAHDKPYTEFFDDIIKNIAEMLKSAEIELYENEATMLLKEYALSEDDTLTDSALSLKNKLREIASWSLRPNGPTPIKLEIENCRKKLDNVEKVDRESVVKMLDAIQKSVDESLYIDGSNEITNLLYNVKGYMTRHIEEAKDDCTNHEDTRLADGSEESVILKRCTSAIKAIANDSK